MYQTSTDTAAFVFGQAQRRNYGYQDTYGRTNHLQRHACTTLCLVYILKVAVFLAATIVHPTLLTVWGCNKIGIVCIPFSCIV